MVDSPSSQNQLNSERVPKNGAQLIQELDTCFEKNRHLSQEKKELAQEELRIEQLQQQFLQKSEADKTETERLLEDIIQYLDIILEWRVLEVRRASVSS